MDISDVGFNLSVTGGAFQYGRTGPMSFLDMPTVPGVPTANGAHDITASLSGPARAALILSTLLCHHIDDLYAHTNPVLSFHRGLFAGMCAGGS